MTAMMIEAALRGMVFAAAVGLGLSLLRVKNVPVRKAAWSVVLLVSMAMPLLMRWMPSRLTWKLPIPMHRAAVPAARGETAAPKVILLRTEPQKEAASASVPQTTAMPILTMAGPQLDVETHESPVSRRWMHLPPTGQLVAMIYLAVTGALLLRLLIGLGAALRLWMTATPVSPLDAPEPNVRSSCSITSPVTIGSGIVLPATYPHWEMDKLRMVLAHERSHVRQMDFYLQLLAGIYTAFFWFSPLGWWLRRTLSSLAEAISDRAGMEAAATRSGYAEIVLEFAAMPRRAQPGVAMACSGNLTRRIERLLNEQLFRNAFAEGRRRALASLLTIPVALFAATAMVRVPVAAAQRATTTVAQTVMRRIPAAEPLDQAVAGDQAVPSDGNQESPNTEVTAAEEQMPPAPPQQDQAAPAPATPATPAATPTPATVPEPPEPEASGNSSSFHFSDDGDSYAVVRGDGKNYSFSGDWSGNHEAEINRARSIAHGPFLWFSHDGKSYVVDDPAVVAHVEALYRPMEELGRRQEELGKQQEALGRQQEALAKQQESASVAVPDMSKEMEQVDAAMAKLKSAQGQQVTQEKLAEMQGRLAELQARLGELQGLAGAKQGEFGEQMGRLGEQQGRLGEQQGRLGEEQGRMAEQADREVRRIIEQTLRNGKATPLQ